MLTLLNTNELVTMPIRRLFDKYDLNKDGFISLNHYYNFITRTYRLWEPIYLFRIVTMNKFFPYDSHLKILERTLHINDIIMYKKDHNNNYPPQERVYRFVGFLICTPHPSHYDYHSDVYRPYNEIINEYIRLFNKNGGRFKESFSTRYLNKFKNYQILSSIDTYFLLYKNNTLVNLQKNVNESSRILLSARRTTYTNPQSILSQESHYGDFGSPHVENRRTRADTSTPSDIGSRFLRDESVSKNPNTQSSKILKESSKFLFSNSEKNYETKTSVKCLVKNYSLEQIDTNKTKTRKETKNRKETISDSYDIPGAVPDGSELSF